MHSRKEQALYTNPSTQGGFLEKTLPTGLAIENSDAQGRTGTGTTRAAKEVRNDVISDNAKYGKKNMKTNVSARSITLNVVG